MKRMTSFGDLLGPQPVLLPEMFDAEDAIAAGADPVRVAADNPAASIAWAQLAEAALDRAGEEVDHDTVAAYAFARTGYHRGLDLLRRNGWKGFGPVPWSHEPNRGFLRCLAQLALSARAIDETEEWERCSTFLRDSSPVAYDALLT